MAKLSGRRDIQNLRSKVFVTASESAQQYYQLEALDVRRVKMEESTQELFDDNFSTAKREKTPEEVQAEEAAAAKKAEQEARRARWPDLFEGKAKEANNQSIEFKKGMRGELQKLMSNPEVLANYEEKMAELAAARNSRTPLPKADMENILSLVEKAQKALDDDIDENMNDPWGIVAFIVEAYCQGIEPEGGMGLSATIKFFLDYTTPKWIEKYETWEGDVVKAIENNAKLEYFKEGRIEEEWVASVEGEDRDNRIAAETEKAARANPLQFFFYRLVSGVGGGDGQGAESAKGLLRPIGFLREVQKNATTFMSKMADAIDGCNLFINDPDLRFVLGTLRVYLMYSRREDWENDVSEKRLLDWLDKATTTALKKKGRDDAGGLSVIDMFVRANDPDELIPICERIQNVTDPMVLVNPTTLLQDISTQVEKSIGTVAAIDVMCGKPDNVFPRSLPKEKWLQCGTAISKVLKQTSDEQKASLEELKGLYIFAANTHGYVQNQNQEKFKTDFPMFVSDLMDSIITSAKAWKPERDFLLGQEEEKKLEKERQDRMESPEFYKRLDELNAAAATAGAVAAGAQAQASGSSSVGVGPLAESAAESRNEFLEEQLLKFKELVSEVRTLMEKNNEELKAENGYSTAVMMKAQNLRTLLNSTLEERLVEKLTTQDMLAMSNTHTKIVNYQETIVKAIEVRSNARQSMDLLLSKLQDKRVYNGNNPAAPDYPGLKELYERIVRLYEEAQQLIAGANYKASQFKVAAVETELDKVEAERSKARTKEATRQERADAVARERRYLINIRTMNRYYVQTNQPDFIIKRYYVQDEFEPPKILEARFIQAKEEVAQKEAQDTRDRNRKADEKKERESVKGTMEAAIKGRRQPDSDSDDDDSSSDDDATPPPGAASSGVEEDGPVQWFNMNVNTELDISNVREEDVAKMEPIDRKATQGAFTGRAATSAERAVVNDELKSVGSSASARIAAAKAALESSTAMKAKVAAAAAEARSSEASSSKDAPPPQRPTPPKASRTPPPGAPPPPTPPPANPNPGNLPPPPLAPNAPPAPPPPPALRFLGGTPDTVRQQFVSTARRVRAAMKVRNKRMATKTSSIGMALAAIAEDEVGNEEKALCERLHYTVSSAIEQFYTDDREGLQQLVDGVPPESPSVLDAVVYMLSRE